MIQFLQYALTVSLLLNALTIGVALAAMLALSHEKRQDYLRKLESLPGWARKLA